MGRTWMLYGATGYTGRLIATAARDAGLTPILAGRNAEALESMAGELGLDWRAFTLDDPAALDEGLRDISLVLLAAGPFSATSAPMLDACLRNGAHYLDITGEVDVFEHAHGRDADARGAGIVVCPGVGFDVIPTDCIAATLKAALPDATHLRLGFDSRSGPSPGTARTAMEGLAGGGRARIDGVIRQVPLGWKTLNIDFGDGPKTAVTIPWGDIATAYYTTAIPNIETYIPMAPRTARRLARANWIRPLLATGPVQRFLQRRAARIQGPDAARRKKTPTHVWGEVVNDRGDIRTARVRTANGYDVTTHGALAVVRHLLETDVAPGATTPSRLMGPDFVTRLPGSTSIDLD
ncbi:saccharopine dehydrogenase family protein [Aquisalimonas asiatica]|uniref:Uncharacterized conserved protein n=1 Tax=Aquisalimonas asiatica TaxID=406100 RepID=A0A1H8V3C5_9GAMM|nr:saccharopine dehydrogenase NADP-binding domain-containing protein [Aquisalimonas asiatica]SEP09891.1 Uncharacterized conserved protein [Aquisalimonas asiatica]